jgi:hypothetical protein
MRGWGDAWGVPMRGCLHIRTVGARIDGGGVADIAYNSVNLAGKLLDRNDKPVDPCTPYANSRRFPPSGVPCPTSYVAVGVSGKRDIVPIAALLQAAGVTSLDMAFSTNPSDLTLR